VAGYGGEAVTGRVTAASRRDDGGFDVRLDGGRAVTARRLLVTTGVVDELPDVPGVAERWGRDVLHCPYCHGHEVRNQPIGVLGTNGLAVHAALLWRHWTADLTLFRHTAPALTAEEAEQLAARGVTVIDGIVAGLEVQGDRLTGVRLIDGTVVPRTAVVVFSRVAVRPGLLTALGIEPVPQLMGDVVVGTTVPSDAMGATAVPGVWVAGNVADPRSQVISAAAGGLNAAAAINADLIAEDTRHAVDAHRARLAVV